MRRAQRRLGWLLAGAAVLVALAAWQWHRERAAATLLPLDPASISRIDITWKGQPTRHYVKRDGQWYLTGASAHRVDDAYPARLVKLAATPVLEWRKASAMHLDAIGLTAPPVIVQLDGHALAYGTLAAFGPQRFVRVGGRIAVIPASYSPRASASAASPSSSQKS